MWADLPEHAPLIDEAQLLTQYNFKVTYCGKQLGYRDIEDLLSKCVKPQLPADSECCGEGCSPCVFDAYD
jgi:hypothetical protein